MHKCSNDQVGQTEIIVMLIILVIVVYFHSNDLEARQRMERRRLEEVHREELQLHDGLSESLLHIYGASLVPKVVGTVLMVFY